MIKWSLKNNYIDGYKILALTSSLFFVVVIIANQLAQETRTDSNCKHEKLMTNVILQTILDAFGLAAKFFIMKIV